MKNYNVLNEIDSKIRAITKIVYDKAYDKGFKDGMKAGEKVQTSYEYVNLCELSGESYNQGYVEASEKFKDNVYIGMKSSWDIAKKLISIWSESTDDELKKVFGYEDIVSIFNNYSAEEIKERLEVFNNLYKCNVEDSDDQNKEASGCKCKDNKSNQTCCKSKSTLEIEKEIIESYSKGLEKGTTQAWEVAQLICDTSRKKLISMGFILDEDLSDFDIDEYEYSSKVILNYSLKDAVHIIKNYENDQLEKSKLKVGDEVKSIHNNNTYVVVKVTDNSIVLLGEGTVFETIHKNNYVKTGKHFSVKTGKYFSRIADDIK